MESLIGITLGLAIAVGANLAGFDRDRSFYPVVLIVIAAYYVLFAVMGAPHQVVAAELVVAAGFCFAAIIGFHASLWIVAVGLIAHGVFDYGHHLFVDSPAVPGWWPAFCLAVDATLGLWLAAMLIRRSEQ